VGRYLFDPLHHNSLAMSLHQRACRLIQWGCILYGMGKLIFWIGDARPDWRALVRDDYLAPLHLHLNGWELLDITFEYMIGITGRSLIGIGLFVLMLDDEQETHHKTAPKTSPAARWMDGIIQLRNHPRVISFQENVILRRLYPIFSVYGSSALTMYIVHYMLILIPLRIYQELWLQITPETEVENVFPLYVCYILGICFLVAYYHVIQWMNQRDIPRLEHAMRYFCQSFVLHLGPSRGDKQKQTTVKSAHAGKTD